MKSLSYLNKYFIKYKWQLLAGTFFVIAKNYFAIKVPLFWKDVIDNFSGNGSEPVHIFGFDMDLQSYDKLTAAAYIALISIGLSIISGIFLFFTRQTIIKVSRLIEYDLKNEIYSQYQRLDYTFYKQNNTGDLMNRISEDVSQVRMYLGPGVMYNIDLVTLTFMVVFQMIFINSWLTFIVLLPLPLMSFLIYKVSKRINQVSTKVQKEQSKLSTIVQETFSGIRIIKAYSRENQLNEQIIHSSNEYKKQNMHLVRINALFMPTIVFLIGLSTVLSIYVGGLFSYETTKDAITFGGITAFIFFVNKLTWPFASLGWLTAIIQRAAASQTRINEFLKERPKIFNQNIAPFHFEGDITFNNVTYTYPNSGIVAVKNLSFEVKKGETTAIIGRTASGKSTILKLILRQIDPDSGEILIDGVNIKDINLNEFRNQTGIVPQDVFLFSDTITNNLKFGALDDNIVEDDLVRVTKEAHVFHNIDAFENKFETLLGERGVNLSGGQKQRISIARALIRNPKLLLFDDCLSAVDTETEEIILGNLKKNYAEQTTIIVSHRVSSLRNANQIVVLEGGTQVEKGDHETLMHLNGIYAEIYNNQLAEEQIEDTLDNELL